MGDHDQPTNTRRHIIVAVQGLSDPVTGRLLPEEMPRAFLAGQQLSERGLKNVAELIYVPKDDPAARDTAFGIAAGLGNLTQMHIRAREDLKKHPQLTPPHETLHRQLSQMLGVHGLVSEGAERMFKALRNMARYISADETLLVIMDSPGAELAGDPSTTHFGPSPFNAMSYIMDVGLNTSDIDVTFVSSNILYLND